MGLNVGPQDVKNTYKIFLIYFDDELLTINSNQRLIDSPTLFAFRLVGNYIFRPTIADRRLSLHQRHIVVVQCKMQYKSNSNSNGQTNYCYRKYYQNGLVCRIDHFKY